MFENNIKIKGKITNEPKKSKDKIYLTMHTSIKNDTNSKSLVYVELTEKHWRVIKNHYKNKEVEIFGKIEIKKSKSDIPFVYLKCDNIKILKNKEKYTPWYNLVDLSELIELDPKEVYLKENEHLKGILNFNVNFNIKPIAVKKDQNNKYYLISGFKSYLHAKILDKKLKVYVTDMEFEKFNEKYNIS